MLVENFTVSFGFELPPARLVSHCVPAAAERARLFAVHKGAVKIGFGTKDKRVGLKIGAECRAGKETLYAEIPRGAAGITGIDPVAGAKALAQIEAEIDAAPVVNRRHRRNVSGWSARRWRHGRRRWQVRGEPLAPSG